MKTDDKVCPPWRIGVAAMLAGLALNVSWIVVYNLARKPATTETPAVASAPQWVYAISPFCSVLGLCVLVGVLAHAVIRFRRAQAKGSWYWYVAAVISMLTVTAYWWSKALWLICVIFLHRFGSWHMD